MQLEEYAGQGGRLLGIMVRGTALGPAPEVAQKSNLGPECCEVRLGVATDDIVLVQGAGQAQRPKRLGPGQARRG